MNSKDPRACSFSYLKPQGESLSEQGTKNHPKKIFSPGPFVHVCTHPTGCKAYPNDWMLTPNPVQKPQDPKNEMLLCFHPSIENNKPTGGSPPHA